MVQDHHGALTLDSAPRPTNAPVHAPSTVFTILLPSWQGDHASIITPTDAVIPTRSGDGERILVVEDEPEVLGVTLRIFVSLGFDPRGASDPEAAVALFETNPEDWDLVVTDLLMPNLSGAEVARRVKALRPCCPVVLVTGYAAEHDLSLAPVEAILIKPVARAAWEKTLRRVLQAGTAKAR